MVTAVPGKRLIAGEGWSLRAERVARLTGREQPASQEWRASRERLTGQEWRAGQEWPAGQEWRALIGVRHGLKLLVTGTDAAGDVGIEAWAGEQEESDGVAVIVAGDGDLRLARLPLCSCGDRGCGNVGKQLNTYVAGDRLPGLVDVLRGLTCWASRGLRCCGPTTASTARVHARQDRRDQGPAGGRRRGRGPGRADQPGRAGGGRRGDPPAQPGAGVRPLVHAVRRRAERPVRPGAAGRLGITDRLPAGAALDAVCGTGRHAAHLAGRGHTVIGVDLSEGMLAAARASVPGGDFRLGDVRRLPVPDEHVDLVVCALALTHVQDLAPVFAEFARVLRPGGHLVISDSRMDYTVVLAQPDGSYGYLPHHKHATSEYLTAALPAGLEVRHCEELRFPRLDPAAAPPPERTRPAHASDFWSLRPWVPAAFRGAYSGSPLMIFWDFERAGR